MSSRTYLALLLTALLLPLTSHASPPRHTVPRYTVTVLPFNFSPTDINNAGQIAGTTELSPGVRHAVLLSKGELKDLGTLGGTISGALAMNEAGDVTGFSLTSAGIQHAFLYTHGRMKDIGARGPSDSGGLGLNDKRHVVGQFVNPQNLFRAALFSHHRVEDLGSLGGPISAAFDINNAGTIVGESMITSEPGITPFHPFVIKNGVMTDIGTLAGGTNNSAQQINNCGQIAGYSEVAGALHVFLYDNGVMTDGGFFGGRQLTVEDMNEQGMIVGTAETPATPVGYLYANGQLRDLDELVNPAEWDIQSAHGINDFGQIVATGCRDNVCSVLRLDPIKPIAKPCSISRRHN